MRKTGNLIGLLLVLAPAFFGCAGVAEKYPSNEAKTFFSAAQEANYVALMCQSPHQADLSGYTPYLGIKYPPTTHVDVLSALPIRPYQAFAVLQSANSARSSTSIDNDPEVLAQLTNKAKAIGADAIVICGSPASKVEAVAIKYRKENPQERQGSP